MKLISIICFFYGFYAVNGATTVEVSTSNATVEQGGDVDITCKINEYPGSSTLVSWYKRQGEEYKVQLGTNSQLSDTFKDTGRYTAKFENVDGAAQYTIMIRGAAAEDSGEIGCEIESLNIDTVYTSMKVLVPVEKIQLFGLDENLDDVKEYSDGQKVVFFEGDKFYFRCEASGSNPEPKFEITLNDESVIDKFDYKSSYTVTGGQPGLKQVEYHAMITTNTAVVLNKDQNAVPFKCSASVEKTEPKTISITPSMSFAPHITCEKYQYDLPVFSLNLEVVCTVKSDPHTDDIFLFWQNIHGVNNTLRSDDEYGHYRMVVSNGDTTDERKVKFIVDRLGPQSFRTYTLYAKNAEGLSSKDIILKRDISQESSSSTLSSFSIITTILMSYAVVFL